MKIARLSYRCLAAFFLVSAMISVTGCAGIEPPKPAELLKHPFGTSSLRVGATKDQILAQWGEPDIKEYDNTGKWENAKEKWTYYGRCDNLPFDEGYLTKDQCLYFDGKHLVKFNE